jgi:hypothetical protein
MWLRHQICPEAASYIFGGSLTPFSKPGGGIHPIIPQEAIGQVIGRAIIIAGFTVWTIDYSCVLHSAPAMPRTHHKQHSTSTLIHPEGYKSEGALSSAGTVRRLVRCHVWQRSIVMQFSMLE